MASENETVMDVCAEWRDCIESADPSVWNDERIAGLVKTTKAQQLAYLDRIEAAAKREKAEAEADALAVGGIVEAARHRPGNAAVMREALEKIAHYCDDIYGMYDPDCADGHILSDIARTALSAPLRNCDVGTAEEQEERYLKLKREHVDRLTRCPAVGQSFFPDSLYWAQMPYEAQEGGAE